VLRQASTRAGFDSVTPDEKAAAFIAKDPEAYRNGLRLTANGLRTVTDWSAVTLEAELRKIAEAHGMKAGAVMQPVRIALTGSTVSEPVNELLVVVGREAALARLSAAAS
jgi:glutamyl-tRNA synthetase